MKGKLLRPALVLTGLFTLLLGLGYPAAMTGLAHLAFPWRAQGSLIFSQGRVVGSEWIGQAFRDPGRFWGRPSATAPAACNAAASSGSNLGPLNPALREAVAGRARAMRAADPGQCAPIPADLVTASGSGLDPHISPAAALWQVPRVARARALPEKDVRRLVLSLSEGRWLGIFGEPRVNVLRLNLALDRLAARGDRTE
jgi:potassium-transporting ATPase KdpC subunit